MDDHFVWLLLFSSFGVDENFLKVVFANLYVLLSLRFHADDLMSFLQPLADVEQYEEWQQKHGQRPEVWQTLTETVARESTIPPPFAHRPSVIGILAGARLQSRSHIDEPSTTTSRSRINIGGIPIPAEEDFRAAASQSLVGAIVGRGAPASFESNDAGWGDSMGVEAYPKSISTTQQRTRLQSV